MVSASMLPIAKLAERALAAEARAARYRKALEEIAEGRCPERWQSERCPESWALSMGGKIPADEQRRRWCASCIARAALSATEEE